MRVTSESLCLSIALSTEGEEGPAQGLAGTSVGQPALPAHAPYVLETNSLSSHDKMPVVICARTNSPAMEVWKHQRCYTSCEFKQ